MILSRMRHCWSALCLCTNIDRYPILKERGTDGDTDLSPVSFHIALHTSFEVVFLAYNILFHLVSWLWADAARRKDVSVIIRKIARGYTARRRVESPLYVTRRSLLTQEARQTRHDREFSISYRSEEIQYWRIGRSSSTYPRLTWDQAEPFFSRGRRLAVYDSTSSEGNLYAWCLSYHIHVFDILYCHENFFSFLFF